MAEAHVGGHGEGLMAWQGLDRLSAGQAVSVLMLRRNVDRMGGEVWGTVAVNDHCRSDAFLREVLLFDRLVIPVPSSPEERDRWRHPNPHDPAETWHPGALDAALSVLGTQRRPFKDGTALAWESPWDTDRWQAGKSRLDVAAAITTIDAFSATRMVLAMEEKLPAIVEAVAALPVGGGLLWRCRPAGTAARRPDGR
jgi:hypothetical protein